MYEEYWALKEKPFQNTPDPHFFYESSEHEGINRICDLSLLVGMDKNLKCIDDKIVEESLQIIG